MKKKNFNKNAISNKTRHVEAERKLDDHMTSYTKTVNDLSGKFKLI